MTVNRAMNEERLKPCPFCGGEGNVSLNTCYGFVPWCSNEDCILNENTKGFSTKEEAIETWNTRKPMERIVERLENMKLIRVEQCHEDYELELITEGHFDDAIEIVKGGGVDE